MHYQKHTEETKLKMSLAHKGKHLSKEHKLKISLSNLGRLPPYNWKEIQARAWKANKKRTGERNYFFGKHFLGENHPQWKGDDVGYQGIHRWIRIKLGKIAECVYCGEDQKLIEWASISHKAKKRDLDDFIPLCRSCHRKYDKSWILRERNFNGSFI